MNRAKELIWVAKEAGADAAKFQHFKAEKIVSDVGFQNLKIGHQKDWNTSVYEIYKKYECNREWTEELIQTAKKADIDFLTTPYDIEAIHIMKDRVPAFKIGSGDITWLSFIENIAQINKPVLLATGASSKCDVDRAVVAIRKYNNQIVLMQCNTNYTVSPEKMKYVNLNVLNLYSEYYPDVVLGLSDHTSGHATVLGAIALGARVIEKHLTDDNEREGPDHSFSMNPITWREMMNHSRELEAALGDGIKRIEKNEEETSVIQRRCLRFTRDMNIGEIITEEDVESLRPAPEGSLPPYRLEEILGKPMTVSKKNGEAVSISDVMQT